MSRSDTERISDALSHIEAIHRHLANGSVSQETVADAVAMRLSAAIESLRTTDGSLETRLFGDEWPAIWATRNHIAHGYAFVDIRIIEDTIANNLPMFENVLGNELKGYGEA